MSGFARALTALTALFLAGCAPQLKTEPVVGTLPPGIERAYKVGDEVLLRDNDGGEHSIRVTAIRGDVLDVVHVEKDCRRTYYTTGFAPALKSEGCADNVERTAERNGSIFPMTVGSREEWKIVATRGTEKTGPYTRTCIVDGTARITVLAGTFDTYVVQCEDRFLTRTHYFAPSTRRFVHMRQTVKRVNTFYSHELVKFTPGA